MLNWNYVSHKLHTLRCHDVIKDIRIARETPSSIFIYTSIECGSKSLELVEALVMKDLNV